MNFSPFPILETERLFLRKIDLEDKQEIFMLRSDEAINKYTGIPKPKSIDDVIAYINMIDENIIQNESVLWGITIKNQKNIIGTICFWNISDDKKKADIGFVLNTNYHRKGFTFEAAKRVVNYGIEELGFEQINGEVDPSNLSSIKLLLKLGFQLDTESGALGNKNSEKPDTAIYVKLRDY